MRKVRVEHLYWQASKQEGNRQECLFAFLFPYVMEPDDEDNYEEFKEPQVEIISEYVVIPELD